MLRDRRVRSRVRAFSFVVLEWSSIKDEKKPHRYSEYSDQSYGGFSYKNLLLLFCEALFKFFYASRSIHQFGATSIERVAMRAYFNFIFFFGRSHAKRMSACAVDFCLMICWMSFFFHTRRVAWIAVFCKDRCLKLVRGIPSFSLQKLKLSGMMNFIMNTNISSVENIVPVTPIDSEMEDMLKAGVHLGHAKSKNHSAMQPYLFGVRNTISIIDLIKTKTKLAEATAFLKDVVSRGGTVLLVGTRPVSRMLVKELGAKTGMPYFAERWIGGTLTNHKIISHRVEYMERLEKEKATGEFEKYTKRERLKKEEEIAKMKKNFDGLRALKKLPEAVFVVDITHDTTAVNESKIMKVPLVALVDTNSPAQRVEYAIPSNDNALPAVRYMIGRIGDAIMEGLRERTNAEKKS